MQNLYDRITNLVKEREELNRRGGILKYDARRGIPEAKEEFDRIVARYKQVEVEIDRIDQDYAIGIEEMGEIISKNMGETYIPKIFNEVYEKDGERYYTERFMACYINQSHPYYSSEKYSISVLEDEFKTLMQNLDKTNTIMFSNSGELDYRPMFPANAFRGTNFIKIYTGGWHHTYDFSNSFIEKVEPMLIKELEHTNIIVNDENFNNGL